MGVGIFDLESSAKSSFKNWRWVFLFLAFAATTINYLDRQTLSVLAPILHEQFRLSDLGYSRVVSAFLFAYTIANGLSGIIIDRIGTKWGYGLCMLWWSTASVLHAFARSALSLGTCRFLLGFGEAGNWPAAIKMVAEWFPAQQRALASGIFNSGSSIGAAIAPPLVAAIALHFGWRGAFASIGALGFLWTFLWLALYFVPERARAAVPVSRSGSGLLRSRFVWSLTLAKVFFDPAWYFYVFWFPQYLSSARHFSLAQIGLYAWIPFVTADCGNVAGGLFCRWLVGIGLGLIRSRRISLAVFVCFMTAAIPAVLVLDPRASIAWVSLATFGYTGSLANMLALPGDFFPPNVLGSIWGFASMGSGFGGILFTLLVGWIVERFAYVPVFIGFGLMPLLALSILLLVTTRNEVKLCN